MVESLEKLLSEGGLKFTKQFHAPCMTHVLNLAIQGGLKELGNSSLTSLFSESEGDEECEEDEVEVTSQRPFGAILHHFEKLLLWQIVHHKEFISTRNCARGKTCQTKTD